MENNNINGNPWKGLSSYTYQDADRFYGRDQELKDIASVIKQNAFTTLYGISGAGKTSIINAGLFPLLDKQSFLPIYIRLDHNVGHVSYDMQIIKAVDDALAAIKAEPEQIVGHKVESKLDKLWLYFHSHRFWSKDNHIVNPIIFIDQFEEIFTKNEDAENIWSFFNIIDSLQYSTPTERIIHAMERADQFVSFGEEQNFRMVFSMREDFLARLEDYSYNIPALRKNRIGLKPLNGLQALEVILKPRPDMVNRKVALHIISKIVGKTTADNERKLEATSVDTSILSLFCTELYNYAMNDNKGEITIPLVDLYGGNILDWFYDRNMQKLPKQTYIYLEDQLLTPSGFRNSMALENLLYKGVQQAQLDQLAENRIVRIEEVNHTLRVEFTHDVLCQIAMKRKTERDKKEQTKSEKSACRAFTVDTSIFLCLLSVPLMSLYYNGIASPGALPLMGIIAVGLIYYVFLVHRYVADRNESYTMLGLVAVLAASLLSLRITKGNWWPAVFHQHMMSSSVFLILLIICAVVYGLLYMRAPKDVSYKRYIQNALQFLSFQKYKSFALCLQLILLVFAYPFVWMLGGLYNDVYPFVVLPVMTVITLCLAKQLLHQPTPWRPFLLTVVPPVVAAEEVMMASQYLTGDTKRLMLWLPVVVVGSTTVWALLYRQNLTLRRWSVILRSLFTAVVVAVALPYFCVGYNLYSTSLMPYKRVAYGAITSNVCYMRFLQIADEKGQHGVIDESEVLIRPQYAMIHPVASVGDSQRRLGYAWQKFFCDITEKSKQFRYDSEYHMTFITFDDENDSGKLRNIEVEANSNKYARHLQDKWTKGVDLMNDYSEFMLEQAVSLGMDNTQIQKIICRLFIRSLFLNSKMDNEYISIDDNGNWEDRYNELSKKNKVLQRCYNDNSLSDLVANSKEFDNWDIYCSILRNYRLLKYDSTGQIGRFLVDSLWNAYEYMDEEWYAYDKSLFLLYAKEYAAAEQVARDFLSREQGDYEDRNSAVCYLILGLYVQQKDDEAFQLVTQYKDSTCFALGRRRLGVEIIDHLRDLSTVGIVSVSDLRWKKLCSYLSDYVSIPSYDRLRQVEKIEFCWKNDKTVHFVMHGGHMVIGDINYAECNDSTMPLMVYAQNSVRYVDTSNGRLLSGKYECGWPFHNGLAAVQRGGKIGFIDPKGQLVIPFKFDGIPVSQFFNYFNWQLQSSNETEADSNNPYDLPDFDGGLSTYIIYENGSAVTLSDRIAK